MTDRQGHKWKRDNMFPDLSHCKNCEIVCSLDVGEWDDLSCKDIQELIKEKKLTKEEEDNN